MKKYLGFVLALGLGLAAAGSCPHTVAVAAPARGFTAGTCNDASDAACSGRSAGDPCRNGEIPGTCEIPPLTANLLGGCFCLGGR